VKKNEKNNMRMKKHLVLLLGALGGSAALAPVTAHANTMGIFVGNHDDGSTSTVGEYTLSGTTLSSSSPSLISGLYEPAGIAISGSDLFVTNQTSGGTGLITEYTTAGSLVGAGPLVTSGQNGASLSTPAGIAVSGSDLFVANYGANSIGEYTTSGATVNASLISGLSGPIGVAIYGSDLFVGNINSTGSHADQAVEYNLATPTPTLLGSLTLGSSANGIAVSANGANLYVTSNSGNAIYDYATSNIMLAGNASPTATWTDTGYTSAYGIAIYGSDLFVTQDQSVNDVLEFTTSGSPVSTTPDPLITGLNDPYAIAVPEPASLGLMAMGSMMLLAKRRKKA